MGCCMLRSPMHSHILTRRLFSPPHHLPPLQLPSPRETHFWYVVPDEVNEVSLLNQYMELLSPCEKQSVLCLNGDKLQKGALLARALVRTTLARYTDFTVNPSSLKFRKNKFGKPQVVWQHVDDWIPPSLHFNVSHTSSLIACGVSLDASIGIDVEEKQRQPKNTVLSFARRYFSPNEVEFLHAFPDPESQRREFIKLWTLKEAYVKALGRGFSAAPFRNFTIRFTTSKGKQVHAESGSKIVVEVPHGSQELTANWQFAIFDLNGSHYAAVCVEGDEETQGCKGDPLRLKLWKTIPLVEDECVLEMDSVVNINGLSLC